jgi:hypothetical protein
MGVAPAVTVGTINYRWRPVLLNTLVKRAVVPVAEGGGFALKLNKTNNKGEAHT